MVPPVVPFFWVSDRRVGRSSPPYMGGRELRLPPDALGAALASSRSRPNPKRWSRRQWYAFVTNMAEPPRGDSSVPAYTVTPLGRLPCVLHQKMGEKVLLGLFCELPQLLETLRNDNAFIIGPLWPPAPGYARPRNAAHPGGSTTSRYTCAPSI